MPAFVAPWLSEEEKGCRGNCGSDIEREHFGENIKQPQSFCAGFPHIVVK